MKLFQVLGFVALAAAPVGSAIAAGALASGCTGCTEAQYAQVAHNLHNGNWVVYDFANNHLRKYSVTSEPAAGGGLTYFADPIGVTAAEQARFDLARPLWNVHLHSLAYHRGIHASDMNGVQLKSNTGNGYDVILDGGIQHDMIQCMMTRCDLDPAQQVNETVARDFITLMNDVNGIVFKDHPISFTLTVTMNDGSTATFEWKAGSAPVLTEVTNSSGTPIPQTVSQLGNPQSPYGNRYDFDGHHEDLPNFVNYLQERFNVSVTAGGTWKMSCGSVSGSPGVVCRFIPR